MPQGKGLPPGRAGLLCYLVVGFGEGVKVEELPSHSFSNRTESNVRIRVQPFI